MAKIDKLEEEIRQLKDIPIPAEIGCLEDLLELPEEDAIKVICRDWSEGRFDAETLIHAAIEVGHKVGRKEGATSMLNLQQAADEQCLIEGHRHCDSYLDNPSPETPDCLLAWLLVERSPATVRRACGRMETTYPLYATYKGKPVRLTMASRMGDVGIVYDLSKSQGYNDRVWLDELEAFRRTP